MSGDEKIPVNSGPPIFGRAGMSDPGEMLDIVMSRRGASPVLVGRAAEMAALEAALDAVRQGEPAAVLIGGEAGMGKTRLIAEFTAAARGAGVRVLTGACLELGADGLPYSPFTAMLRDLVREVGVSEIASRLSGSGRAARELARLLPELSAGWAPGRPNEGVPNGSVAAAVEGGDAYPGGVMTAGEARAHLFEGFLTLLERLADQGPLALIIEDAHWADRSSRDLLAFLIGYQRAVRNLLIVVTFRSDELHRTHPLRPLLAELARIEWVDRTELPPLTRGQAEELAAVVLGQAPEGSLADAIFERAQGNPLFTEELLACSDGSDGCDIVPDSLADLLLQAVRRLPEDTQEVLRVASAGSGVTSDALLAQVTGLGAGNLSGAIRPAVAANVLVTSGDGYSFRHALIQEAVHADLLPGEHAAVHTRFAGAIDVDPSLVSVGRADIEKAHHWYSAHNTTGALAASWRATTQASNAVAHAERLMLLDRVLELWEQVPDAAAQTGADHVRVLEEAVAAAGDAAEYQRGLALVELALTELDEAAEPVRFAQLLRRRFSFHKDLGLTPSEADLHRALALVPEDVSPSVRTDILIAVAHCGIDVEGPEYRGWAADALRLARALGNTDAQAEALTNLAMLEAGRNQVAASDSEAFRLLLQARELTKQAWAYHPIIKLVIIETHLLCGAGEYERAVRAARDGIADAERHGLARTGGAFLAINLAEPLLYLGRWDEAAEVVGRALDLAPPRTRTRVGLWVVDGVIALARGDIAMAARRAGASRAVLAAGSYDEQYHLPLAELDIGVALAAEGPVAAVAAAVEVLRQYDVSAGSPRYAWPLLVTAAAAAVQAPGEEAAALLDKLRTLAEKLDVCGPVQRAWQLSFAALDPATVLDTDDGGRLAAADAAVAAWEVIGQPYQAAVALTYAVRVALAERAGHQAAVRLRRAAPIAQRLGAFPLAAQLAELSRRAGPSGDADEPGLTARELEVLRLVAAGQSNREIAAALVISPKTASVHVSNILAKLGAATRTEAAVKAHQLLLL
jgi:DNA-binding CsgD family transcriptional regulator